MIRFPLLGFFSILLLLLSLSYFVLSSSVNEKPPLSIYSDEWDGTSHALKILENFSSVEVLKTSPEGLAKETDIEKSLYVVMGVERGYSEREAETIHDFVKKGGKALILDDSGGANPLLNLFGMEITGYPLYDQYYLKNPAFVLVEVNIPMFSGVVLTDKPSTIETQYSLVWAHSSDEGWVDKNGNGMIDKSSPILERKGEYPVITEYNPHFRVDKGSGDLIVISDSSMFINDLLPRANNTEFLKALLNYFLPGGGTIIIDESQHPPTSPSDAYTRAVLKSSIVISTYPINLILSLLFFLLIFPIYFLYQPGVEYRKIQLKTPELYLLKNPFLDREDMGGLRKLSIHLLSEKFSISPDDVRSVLDSLPVEFFEIKKLLSGEDLNQEEVIRCLLILSHL